MTLNDLEHYKVKGTAYTLHIYQIPGVPNFSPFRSTSRLWVPVHLRPDVPSMVKDTLMHVLLVSLSSKCQFSSLYWQPFFFALQVILK